MYGGYGYSSAVASGLAMMVAVIVCLVIALSGGIVLFCTFLAKKNEGKFRGFADFLYKFLNFKTLLSELIIKVVYTISAIFVTLYSLAYLLIAYEPNIGIKFLVFTGILVLGNVILRVVYEFIIIKLIVCQNTSDINEKLSKLTNGETSSDNKSSVLGVNEEKSYRTESNNQSCDYKRVQIDNRITPQMQDSNIMASMPRTSTPYNQQRFNRQVNNTVCYSCGQVVNKTTGVCKHCGAIFE